MPEEGVVYRCFHCREDFSGQEALIHFGLDELELPACVQMLTEGEKHIVEVNRILRAENTAQRHHIEDLRYQIPNCFDYHAFGKAKDIGEARLNYDFLEGRVQAAEVALNALGPKLASFLRWFAEWKWKRKNK